MRIRHIGALGRSLDLEPEPDCLGQLYHFL